MAAEDLITEPVESFIADLTPVLASIAHEIIPGVPAEKPPQDVTVEAFNLVAAFIDSDERQSDTELWALLRTFAPRMPTQLSYAGPEHVRDARLVSGKRAWLAAPSLLFDILVQTDLTRRTRNSWLYYQRAMELAHAVCAIDAVPSEAELGALERFRSTLLRAIDGAGLPRPGHEGAGPTIAAAGGPGEAAAPKAAPPQEPARPIEELLEELDELIGLGPVKAEVKLVTNLIRVQKLRTERGLPVVESSRHMIFTGNPGTGKTTVARVLGRIFKELGFLSKGHFVEASRSDLVGEYIGHTAPKVQKKVKEALGGVLFIDEAYSLHAKHAFQDFGKEALEALLKLMEDHRDNLVVIVAGYPAEMEEFIESNPGLRSRFTNYVRFPDYTPSELLTVFSHYCETGKYVADAEVKRRVRATLVRIAKENATTFGNARDVRTLFEKMQERLAERVDLSGATDRASLMTFVRSDVPERLRSE